MMLIDTHLHVVSADQGTYPRRPVTAQQLANGSWWDAASPYGGVDAEATLAALRNANIAAAMVVQAYGPYGADNRYLFDSLGRTGSDDVPHPEDPMVLLTSVADPTVDPDALFSGAPTNHGATRLFHIPTPSEPWLDGPEGDRLVGAASRYDLVVVLCVQAHDLGRVERLVRRWPDVPFVLDHCGFADLRTNPSADDSELKPLVSLTNLNLKVTPTAIDLCAPDRDPAEVLGQLVAEFGAHRLVWGSDFPQHRTMPYAEQVAEIVGWTAPLHAADRHSFLAGTATRLWPAFAAVT